MKRLQMSVVLAIVGIAMCLYSCSPASDTPRHSVQIMSTGPPVSLCVTNATIPDVIGLLTNQLRMAGKQRYEIRLDDAEKWSGTKLVLPIGTDPFSPDADTYTRLLHTNLAPTVTLECRRRPVAFVLHEIESQQPNRVRVSFDKRGARVRALAPESVGP